MIAIGTVSSRGQIAIPAAIRAELGLDEGAKVVFLMENNALIMKKAERKSWAELTEPLRRAKKLIREDQVVDFIHKMRREERKLHGKK